MVCLCLDGFNLLLESLQVLILEYKPKCDNNKFSIVLTLQVTVKLVLRQVFSILITTSLTLLLKDVVFVLKL